MTPARKITAQEFKEWLDGAFHGNPADARSWCERTMSPNYLRYQAGGDRTDFERAVEKVTMFRTICKKWESRPEFFLQQDNKIAARLICELCIGNDPERTMELMFMAELDEQGRYEYVWEQSSPYTALE